MNNTSHKYSFIAKSPTTLHLGGLDATLLLANKAKICKTSKILDAGCGAGHSSAFLAKKFDCQVFGIDHAIENINQAKYIYQKLPKESVNFSLGNINKLDFSDNYFDIIMCESVLLFIKNKNQAFKELYRVLKPNGYICINNIALIGNNQQEIQTFLKAQFSLYVENKDVYEKLFTKFKFKTTLYTEETLNIKGWLNAIMPNIFEQSGLLSLLELGHILFTNQSEQQKFIDFTKLCFLNKKYLLNNLNFVMTIIKK